MTRPLDPTIADLKIGDTLYHFDGNRRVYSKDTGRVIYAEHFRPLQIVGETKVSWLVEIGFDKTWSANKKDLACAPSFQFGGNGFFTAFGKDEDVWQHQHKHQIGRLVADATTDQLKAIAKIVGYEP